MFQPTRGLYQPVDYSEQFDLQWELALDTLRSMRLNINCHSKRKNQRHPCVWNLWENPVVSTKMTWGNSNGFDMNRTIFQTGRKPSVLINLCKFVIDPFFKRSTGSCFLTSCCFRIGFVFGDTVDGRNLAPGDR